MFIEQADGCEGPIGFHHKDLPHVMGITEPDALPGEPVIDFVFHLVNGDDAVGGDAPLDLQQEDLVDLILREAPDLLRFRKEPVLWAFPVEGGMYGKVDGQRQKGFP